MLGFKVIHEAMTFVTAQSVAQFICYTGSSGKGCRAACLSPAMLTISEALSSSPPKKTEQYTGISPYYEGLLSENSYNLKLMVVKRDSSAATQRGGLCTLGQTTCALC